MSYTLFLLTYQSIVHFLFSMTMFYMNLQYGLIMNPRYLSVFVYRSYHIIADSMHPYNYFSNHRYSTFTPFSVHTFLCSGFTSHMMSTNSPSILIWRFSPCPVRVKVCPRDIKIATYLPSCALIMSLKNGASGDIVGDYASSLGM